MVTFKNSNRPTRYINSRNQYQPEGKGSNLSTVLQHVIQMLPFLISCSLSYIFFRKLRCFHFYHYTVVLILLWTSHFTSTFLVFVHYGDNYVAIYIICNNKTIDSHRQRLKYTVISIIIKGIESDLWHNNNFRVLYNIYNALLL